VNDFFEWVQQNRAIVNTRDEPLADPNQFRRIHLLLGDSNMAEVATALKLGTTGLVLQLIEEGHAPLDLDLNEPVETMQELSQDQDRQWIVRLQSGQTISAIDIQEAFLAAAQEHYRGQDDETDWVLDQWEAVLQDLRGDYTTWGWSIGPVVAARNLREAEQTTGRPALKSLDWHHNSIKARPIMVHGRRRFHDSPRTRRLFCPWTIHHATPGRRAGRTARHLLAWDLR
jgi:proteasome accessory factor A